MNDLKSGAKHNKQMQMSGFSLISTEYCAMPSEKQGAFSIKKAKPHERKSRISLWGMDAKRPKFYSPSQTTEIEVIASGFSAQIHSSSCIT